MYKHKKISIMTETRIETLVKELLLNQFSSPKVLTQFQKLNDNLEKCESVVFEKNLHSLITTFLSNKNPQLQISAMCVLITCLKKGLYQRNNYLDIAYLVIDIAHDTPVDNVDLQEVWLKAFSALEAMTGLHCEIYKNRTVEMVNIFKKVLGSVCSSLQKINALKLLSNLIKNINSYNLCDLDRDQVHNILLETWVELVCPMIFNMNQLNVQSCAIVQSNDSLTFLQNIFQIENTKCLRMFTSDLQKNYVPVMIKLVSEEKLLFSKLWIFLTKLLGPKFHKGFPVVNMLLQVVEAAFKNQNSDVKEHAFYCWQALIDSFLENPTKCFTEKRIKLLTIPLKSANGKTPAIVEVKLQTWCKLLNAVTAEADNSNQSLIYNIIIQFLYFCFGPLCERPLSSWSNQEAFAIQSQGKKFKEVYLLLCQAFLQLFGNRKYFDEELYSKLKFFNFECPKINIADFCEHSKMIVDSVGESCVMLSDLEHSDRFECAAINLALWKSLFNAVDSLTDEKLKLRSTEQISSLILALAGVARKKSCLINFGLVPLFNIITSGEFKFFKNEEMTALLFIPMVQAVMKKDKALLQYDVLSIFKKIFIYKRDEKNFLKFVQTVLERFSLGIRENIVPEKFTMLHNIWVLLQEELKKYLHNTLKTNIDEEVYTSSFGEFFTWPFSTLYQNFNHEQLSLKWKELYFLYGHCTSNVLQNKLSLQIMKNLSNISNKSSQLDSIAEISYFLISNLNLSAFTEDNYSDIFEIYLLIKTLLQLENIKGEPLKILEKCVQEMFIIKKNMGNFPYFFLFPVMLECLESLLSTHKTTEILNTVKTFIESLKYDDKYKQGLKKLTEIVERNSNLDKKVIDMIMAKCLPKFIKNDKIEEISADVQAKQIASSSKTPQKHVQKLSLRLENIDQKMTQSIEKPIDLAKHIVPPVLNLQKTSSSNDPKIIPQKRGRKPSTKPDCDDQIVSSQHMNCSVVLDLQKSSSSSDSDILSQKRGRKASLKPDCDDQNRSQSPKVEFAHKKTSLSCDSKILSQKSSLENMTESIVKTIDFAKHLQKTSSSNDSEIIPRKRGRKQSLKPEYDDSNRSQSPKVEKTNESAQYTVSPVVLNLKKTSSSDFEILSQKRGRKPTLKPEIVDQNMSQSIDKPDESVLKYKKSPSSSDSEVLPKKRRRKVSMKLESLEQNIKKPIECLKKVPIVLKFQKSASSSSDSETVPKKRGRKPSLKVKELPESREVEKQQIMTLLGHDVDTMAAVKLKGSMMPKKSPGVESQDLRKLKPNDDEFVVVHTPYKFDHKKLTKGQREKLSKRRDDIPALYEDLSQSQTRDFSSNSNSILTENKTDCLIKDGGESTLKPFSELIQAETNESDLKTTENQLATTSANINKPKRGRRKSMNIPRYDETDSIESMKIRYESDPLNTANLDIHSADLNSGNIENSRPEKRKRGKKTKQKLNTSLESEANLNNTPDSPDDSYLPPRRTKRRRCSTGSMRQEEEYFLPADLDSVRQQRVTRELRRIDMDIKHKEEYHKNEKRKTRMSGSFHSILEGNESPKSRYRISPSSSNSDSDRSYNTKMVIRNIFNDENYQESPKELPVAIESDGIVENTPNVEINPLETVNPEEPIIIISKNPKTDVMNDSEPTIPLKIQDCVSLGLTESKQNNFDVPGEEIQTSPKKIIEILSDVILRKPSKDLEQTESINSETIAEIKVNNPEIPTKPENEGLECRMVLFDTLTESSEASNVLLSPLRDQFNNIQTSPVRTDTPTRNKELLHNTSNLSPIKNVQNDGTFDDKIENVQPAETSPEIFSSEPSSSGFELERVGNNSPHPHKIKRKKYSIHVKSSRSAQMMDMISAKTTMSTVTKKPKEPKVVDSFFSPPQNRIMKMMGQLEKNEEKEQSSEEVEKSLIKDEDLLIFCKELPSCDATPSASILKKRKIREESEESAGRSCKRRRVNFSDPPVSCRKYFEKNSRHKHAPVSKLDFIPQEPRVTRSTKDQEEDGIENEVQTVSEEEFLSNIIDHNEKTDSVVTINTDLENDKTIEAPKANEQQKSCEVSVIINNENSKSSESILNSKEGPSTSILNEEIEGGTIRNVFCNTIEILNEKKLNPLPLVKLLLGGSNHFSTSLKDSIIKYISKNSQNNSEIIKELDSKDNCETLLKLAENPNFKQNLFEIIPTVIDDPKELISVLEPKLNIVDIGSSVLRKLDSNNTTQYLKQLFETVPLNEYLKPVPKELLPKDDVRPVETVEELRKTFEETTKLAISKIPVKDLFFIVANLAQQNNE